MSLKRKRNDLAMSERFRVVELLEQGKSQADVAKSVGCSQSQVCRISRSRDAVRTEYEANLNPDRKRHRSGKAPEVESALTEWFNNARSRDIPLNGTILAEKSESLAKLLHNDDFKATNGWLSRWKKRNNIGYKRLHGESKDADTTAAEHWISNVLPSLLKDVSPDDVYNADETAIYFRALPEGTLAYKTDTSGGSKKSKERVTALVATNMSGTDKRRLLIIGKRKDPRCLLSKAWRTVKQTTVSNCFRKAGFPVTMDTTPDHSDPEPDSDVPIPEGMDADAFHDYISHDDDLECHSVPTDEEICANHAPATHPTPDENSDDDDSPPEITLPVTNSEARHHLAELRRFMEECPTPNFDLIYQFEEFIQHASDANKRQSKITEFVQWIP